jgi:asparagine synthase (glutamine-hydrolysing)
MLAYAHSSETDPRTDFSRIAPSLGLFTGAPAAACRHGTALFAKLAKPWARLPDRWNVTRSPDGSAVLLEGQLHNRSELAALLGLGNASDEALYGAAVARWGATADARIVGDYAAVVARPDGSVRLSRSPWAGPPLFYHRSGKTLIAASVPRPILAAGVDGALRPELARELLSLEVGRDTDSHYAAIDQVPHGSIAEIAPDGQLSLDRWYDPAAIAPLRLQTDTDYVDAANAVLAQAVAASLSGVESPAIALSGGLDSAMVCDEVLRQLGPGRSLKSFTFHPAASWDGTAPGGMTGDESAAVRAFAADRPGLEPHFTDNPGIAFDHLAQDFFLACGSVYPAMTIRPAYHGIWRAARAAGCDTMFHAGFGNQTISQHAPWALAEFARRGQFGRLLGAARAQVDDGRPTWRKVAAGGLLPWLPQRARNLIRQLVHGGSADRSGNPFLRHAMSAARGSNVTNVGESVRTRGEFLREIYRAVGMGCEFIHGFEQVFGIAARDVTLHRPLIEFFAAVPTGQFFGEGSDRWLGRRMAAGRMPEAQRLSHSAGLFNADWHARMTARLPQLHEAVGRAAENPELAGLLDIDALRAALAGWPDATPADRELTSALAFHLPTIALVGQFTDFATGRN